VLADRTPLHEGYTTGQDRSVGMDWKKLRPSLRKFEPEGYCSEIGDRTGEFVQDEGFTTTELHILARTDTLYS
jgi:hypothetical protein